MGHEIEKAFPADPKHYQLYEEVGEGVSATVYRALCIPLNEVVAIKVLDLERCNNDLDGIRREVQTMRLIDHPNVVKAYCSFPAGHQLWVVMPYMAGGSCLHIMKFAHPEGFEEPVIATLLREVLKALVYFHSEGHIHRDVKAGNILIDANGAVKLADFGVAACMFDTGDRQRARNTFVGTPCWMAPEVMQQLHGYDFKADIWSFGITALELAHGHAPFSKYPPMKVLLMTLQNAPPGLDYERDKKFSKSFKEMVSACLVKDPKKRPTSEKLMKHHFFKHGRSNEYLARTILDGLPPLADRFRALKEREGDILLNRVDDDKEQLSQREYIRGISAWNFNLEDLKSQAALIQDDAPNLEQSDVNHDTNYKDGNFEMIDSAQQIGSQETDDIANIVTSRKEELQDLQDIDGLLSAAFPIHPLKALEGCFDVYGDEFKDASPKGQVAVPSDSELLFPMHQGSHEVNSESKMTSGNSLESSSSFNKHLEVPGRQKTFSGSLLPEHAPSPARNCALPTERDESPQKHDCERNYSGPLLSRYSPNNSSVNLNDESSKGRVFQRKGRFKVTSSDVGNKVATLVGPVAGLTARATLEAATFLPTLQFILQQNVVQREQIVKLLKLVEEFSGHHAVPSGMSGGELSQPSLTAIKERQLQSYILQLQQQVDDLADELQRIKYKNAQLERKINSFQKEMVIKECDVQPERGCS
ncbi:serine/threonine-protein kinase BLUS1 isoform X2 [Phalaenopsis equestris]|uniref:serine/threonine-protein kinase BLUS1 isoform X2 n=1 Tax=Phalaenopsis equestris TaxID=78828 RepID=UPI0009E26F42|nr:serine/threonine-protein kinase BLUS1 isoform X2 [Phalaenopsis equestris]